jgi:tetratricopeptide (TPR) repeat protein
MKKPVPGTLRVGEPIPPQQAHPTALMKSWYAQSPEPPRQSLELNAGGVEARRHAYQGQAAPGLVHLGEAYERAGKPAEAQRAYQDALAADPNSYVCDAANARLAVLADALRP